MSQRQFFAYFDHEDDLLAAVSAVRAKGYLIDNAYTPYAVHHLEQALGLAPSRLTWVCFVCGMCGAGGMLWFQHWTAAVSWALDVGGKPWDSLPSDVPVAFEAAVLLAGFGSVFALFAACRLFPGKRPRVIHPRVTDDRFVMVLNETDASFEAADVANLLEKFHVLEIEERYSLDGDAV